MIHRTQRLYVFVLVCVIVFGVGVGDVYGAPAQLVQPRAGAGSEAVSCEMIVNNALYDLMSEKVITEAQCAAYKSLDKNFNQIPPPSKGGDPRGITGLNPTFAEKLNEMLMAANSEGYHIRIFSGYRTSDGTSNHSRGLAADLLYPGMSGSNKWVCQTGMQRAGGYRGADGPSSYRWVYDNSKRFSLALFNVRHGFLSGECNHVEATWAPSGGRRGTGPYISTGDVGPGGGDEPYSPWQGGNNTGNSGNSGGNQMMQMMGLMMIMQMGQTLTSSLANNNAYNTPYAQPPPLPPVPLPPLPATTNLVPIAPSPATSTIDTLIKGLRASTTSLEPTSCTMEARQCPDGSWVGRSGPQCEFSPCPITASSSLGQVQSACATDMRRCADGNLVGRVGANCTFAECGSGSIVGGPSMEEEAQNTSGAPDALTISSAPRNTSGQTLSRLDRLVDRLYRTTTSFINAARRVFGIQN